MAAVLHGNAQATPRIRAELQGSEESSRTLAARYQLNPKTVAKWRNRQTTGDAAMGPRDPRSTVLSPAEEASIVKFRRRTMLPLDDVMCCLRDAIPKLTRSALHRCLQRHGISRLPVSNDKASKRGTFKENKSVSSTSTAASCAWLTASVSCFWPLTASQKSTVVEFHQSAGKMEGAAFLCHVIATFPYAMHTGLTDIGMAFADLSENQTGPSRTYLGPHIFDRVCLEHGVNAEPAIIGHERRVTDLVAEREAGFVGFFGLPSLCAWGAGIGGHGGVVSCKAAHPMLLGLRIGAITRGKRGETIRIAGCERPASPKCEAG